VAFLAKDRSPYQQLFFISTIDRGSPHAITPTMNTCRPSISAQCGRYTSLVPPQPAKGSEDDIVDVTGKNIYTLCFRDREPSRMLRRNSCKPTRVRSTILRNGKESRSPSAQAMVNYGPVHSNSFVSPDGRWLITWRRLARSQVREAYEPNSKWDVLRLRKTNAYAVADENPWKSRHNMCWSTCRGATYPHSSVLPLAGD
jgi:hypothetical protein